MYNVVIIDDEELVLIGLTELLDWNDLGYKIVNTFTDDGLSIDKVCDQKPDLVICDLKMNTVNGIDLMEEIAQRIPEVKFAIISAYKDFDAATKAMQLGIKYYILKPFIADDVKKAMINIRNELDDQRSYHSIAQPDNELAAIASSEIKADSYRYCSIAVTDADISFLSDEGVIKRFKLREKEDIFLAVFNNVSFCKKYLWHESIGVSRILIEFDNVQQMIDEAMYSLYCRFNYAFDNDLIANIQYYIVKNMENNISMDELSQKFFISKSYLSSSFKKSVGSSIGAFTQYTKLNMAVYMLGRSELSLKEIAEKIGFQDYGYFGRLFKREFKITPEEYRKKRLTQ